MPQTLAISTKSGLPGGCGMPSTLAAAMYSEVSQNCVVGAMVTTYSARMPANAPAAARYGGCTRPDAVPGWGGLLLGPVPVIHRRGRREKRENAEVVFSVCSKGVCQ